jgi:predicted alpha/beta superfamily hydrolase
MSAVQLPGSEYHTIHSTSTGRDYQIMVSLPIGYHAKAGERWPFSNLPEKWPVVYVLDGHWYFAMVASMLPPMSWCGGITEAIVVGIGYPNDPNDPIEGFRTAFTRRDHDLTPIHDAQTEKSQSESHGYPVPNGDGANFLRFLKEELVPLIDRDYRADPARRILAGHSYGGLFALQALLREPELFSTLIAASPYLAYADRGTFALEDEYASTHSDLAARLFLSSTINEMGADDSTLADTLLLAQQLEKRNYPGLTVVKKIFTEFNHCEVAPPSFHAGLVFALKK